MLVVELRPLIADIAAFKAPNISQKRCWAGVGCWQAKIWRQGQTVAKRS